MFVSSYQMHNVLNVYSKQLSQDRIAGKQKIQSQKPLADQVNFSNEGKRKATIEKVAKEILNRITHYSSKYKVDHKTVYQPHDKIEKHVGSDKQKETNFIFNVIDEVNKKRTNTLSLEDTKFLINELEQSAQETTGKKTNS